MTHPSKLLPNKSNPLTRILETPDLIQQVQSLPAPALLKLINKIGIEDSSALLALATTEQLTKMVDEDLWQRKKAGANETFSADRLSTWLLALEEIGPTLAAEKLADMDEEFLCFAFSHYLNAIDLEALQFLYVRVQGDSWQDERLENLIESHEQQELGPALIIGKQNAPWECILSLLLALEEFDSSLCSRLVNRLIGVTEAKAEREGGLFEVLSQEEVLESDATYSRDLRRTRDGYVPTLDAKAFLDWIRITPTESVASKRDPVSRAYFRNYEGTPMALAAKHAEKINPLLLELAEEEPTLLLPSAIDCPISQLLRKHEGTPAHSQYLQELNFLAQVLLLQDPALRLGEAATEVISACKLGYQMLGEPQTKSMIQLFGVGWKSKL